MLSISSFRSMNNKHDLYKGKDCIKKCCESCRQYVMNLINLKKKEIINTRSAGIM